MPLSEIRIRFDDENQRVTVTSYDAAGKKIDIREMGREDLRHSVAVLLTKAFRSLGLFDDIQRFYFVKRK